MRKALLVALREYRATIRTKGFVIGLLLAPLLMGGSALVFALLKDDVDTRDKRVAVLDRSGLVAEAIVAAAEARNAREVRDPETGEKVKPGYFIEVVAPDDSDPDGQRLALSDRVRRRELHAFVEIGPDVLHPRADPAAARIAYHSRNPLDDLRKWIGAPINVTLRGHRLRETGVDPASAPDLFDWIYPEGLDLLTRDKATGEIQAAGRRHKAEVILIPLVMPGLLFMMILFGAQPRLNAVMEEKSQRIAEVILGSIEPFPFMLGKLVGGVAVALTAALVYVAAGAFIAQRFDVAASVPWHLVPWFFAFLILAILMYGALFAAVGSMCNDPTEAQSVAFPAMIPVIVPMFVQMPLVLHPRSAFATGISLIPPLTPMCMLIRMGTTEGVPAWQPWVGLVGVLLFTALLVWAGGRVFRVGILMQGTPPKLKNLVRWAFRG
jgi:ABC-2 type transport system permease protein